MEHHPISFSAAEHPYRTYSDFLQETFPDGKVQKVAIDAGCSCPNRDGTKGVGGCSYCNNRTFSPEYCRKVKPIGEQMQAGIRFFARKYASMNNFPSKSADTEINADVNEAFNNRNELKSLDLATKIYKKKERIVLAEMLPNLALTANYLISNPNLYNGYKKDFSGMFNVGLVLQVPLSGWWEGTYKRNAARAETNIAQLQLMDAREKIELQVNQSVYKVNEANKRLIASNKNMENAEENLRHVERH